MKRWMVVVGIILVFTFIGGWIFYATGGQGLVRIVPSYLMADVPNKQYGWGDFVPSGATKRVSGFYSATLSNDESLAIWTLTGLRRFYPLPGTSVYSHRDTCGVWRELEKARAQGQQAPGQPVWDNQPDVLFDFASWKQEVQQEYFVTQTGSSRRPRRRFAGNPAPRTAQRANPSTYF